jgi:hypothetical protein
VIYLPTQHIPLNCTAAHSTVAAVWLPLFHITFPSCLSLPADCHLSQFRLFLRNLNSTGSWTPENARATCDFDINFPAPTPANEILIPVFFFWILNFSSFSQAIYCDLAGFAKLQVTTPYTLVPSHLNSSRGSNLRSTLYMWSSPLYGLISLQYLAKCPYLSYNQHSISVSPHHLIAQLPFRSPYRLFYIQCCWIDCRSRYIQYVPWYHIQFQFQWIKQWVNQFSYTHSGPLQQLVTTNRDESPSQTKCHSSLFFRCPASF